MVENQTQRISAKEAGLKACNCCGLIQKFSDESVCERCGSLVKSRSEFSVQRTWAFLLVGLVAYIPANTSPIMQTSSFTGNSQDTIMSGVISLAASGSYLVAMVVFIASIIIPVSKFLIIIALTISLQLSLDLPEKTRHRMHAVTEFIGRWSMIDVFVVAVLAALIQLGAVVTITPGVGINAFALSVVFTMLAASSLDPRLLWDNQPDD